MDDPRERGRTGRRTKVTRASGLAFRLADSMRGLQRHCIVLAFRLCWEDSNLRGERPRLITQRKGPDLQRLQGWPGGFLRLKGETALAQSISSPGGPKNGNVWCSGHLECPAGCKTAGREASVLTFSFYVLQLLHKPLSFLPRTASDSSPLSSVCDGFFVWLNKEACY